MIYAQLNSLRISLTLPPRTGLYLRLAHYGSHRSFCKIQNADRFRFIFLHSDGPVTFSKSHIVSIVDYCLFFYLCYIVVWRSRYFIDP